MKGYCGKYWYSHNNEYCSECEGDSTWCFQVNYTFNIQNKYCKYWKKGKIRNESS